MQQIISQLLFPGEVGLEVAEMSPWLDLRIPPKEIKLELVKLLSRQIHQLQSILTSGLKRMGIHFGLSGKIFERGGPFGICQMFIWYILPI